MERKQPGKAFLNRMQSKEERKKTYFDYPKTAKQQPDKLVDAGFYYTGVTDKVTCPFCRGTMHEWQEDDVPMEEHKTFFPRCSFVKSNYVAATLPQRRGDEDNVDTTSSEESDGDDVEDSSRPTPRNQSETPQARTQEAKQSPANIGASNSASSAAATRYKYKIEARDLRARMERPMIGKLVAMGFDFEVMKRVMYERLLERGEDFESAQDFAAAVMDFEEKQKKLDGNKTTKELCQGCHKREVDTIFRPCGHKLLCYQCTVNMKYCQHCGQRIKTTTHS